MSLNATHLEITTQKLSKFWQGIPSDLQKSIGSEIAFIIGITGSSEDFLTIIQKTVASKIPENNEFNTIIKQILELEQDSQLKIKTQLTEYFISRNSK